MKTQIGSTFFPLGITTWACLIALSLTFPSVCQSGQPIVSSIHPDGSNVVVEVNVPAGTQRVTLESRPRFGQGTWAPLAVAQNDGSQKVVSFRVACTRQTELMRVRADARQPLPASFYSGTNIFSAPGNSTPVSLDPTQGGGSVNGGGVSAAGGTATRTVVESDIWQIDGDTLYFFNQYRGLQVIDISQPDRPVLRGRLDLPAAGEQMYVADANRVILLANGGCGSAWDQSRILVVGVTNGIPVVNTSVAIGGWVQDSRMVGSALYVASQNYRPVSDSTNGVWEWGITVTSFDLGDPEQPVVRSTLWYPGYGNVISATDTYLFVAMQDPTNWWHSIVQIIDVSSSDGAMSEVAQVPTSGQIPDKFKLNYTNEVFTAISEDWRWTTGGGPITRLETFHLPDPRSAGPGAISKLGELELGSKEQLHATRFDGNLVYVVTFFQIDPLWVVDLSDPTNPQIVGSVDVPGWSSYIVPLGDRLVTLGVESNRVAVSLFDVANPAKPALMSRVLLGQNYSWSDANYDEKAFTVLPEQNLVLVPYNGDTTNGWTMQVQLVDLNATNLVARGLIQHQMQPRRTAFSHDRVLSLSGWELLSIDVTNRDEPQLRADLELAWSVDRLFVASDYLLQLSGATGWWGYQTEPGVRVSLLGEPDQVLNKLTLQGLPIVGACVKDNRLYVAQSQAYWYVLAAGASGGSSGQNTNTPNFVVSILDLGKLPNVSLLGQTSIYVDTPGFGGNWQAVWPQSNVLVWAGGGGFWPIFNAGGGITAGPGGGVVGGGMLWPWWGGGGGGQLLGFDVSNPASPRFDSEVNLATNGWWSFSQPFCTGTRVYLSHNVSELATNSAYPGGVWVQQSLLDVIDYADPVTPTVRLPVSIPGTLQGISHEGELLYTLGTHWGTNQVLDWTQWIDASAYDGVAAHLVASLHLSDSWPHPVLVLRTNVLIGDPGDSADTNNIRAPQLEKWFVSDNGTFSLSRTVQLSQPANTLLDRNGLLIAQENDGSLDVFDDSSAGFSLIKHAQPSGCFWFDLNQVDGGIGPGLWAPLGVYGVEQITLGP